MGEQTFFPRERGQLEWAGRFLVAWEDFSPSLSLEWTLGTDSTINELAGRLSRLRAVETCALESLLAYP